MTISTLERMNKVLAWLNLLVGAMMIWFLVWNAQGDRWFWAVVDGILALVNINIARMSFRDIRDRKLRRGYLNNQ